ncbi:hypothetical protein JXA32_14090 [Candidatus Sumerlaeota bacterium]|nr:hypothetical protein [Candidatus Sumerlaeota bacterium]
MSRTNPYKKKHRQAKHTCLLMGEGPTEQAFLIYLKELYLARDSGISCKVENAGGGSPDSIIHTTKKRLRNAAFDRCIVLMNGDRKWPNILLKTISGTKVSFSKSEPCIESLFLRILNCHVPNIQCVRSDVVKGIFHEKYLNKKDKTQAGNYHRIFNHEMLEKQRLSIRQLDDILKCFSDSFYTKKR